jgi:hypothetical protein
MPRPADPPGEHEADPPGEHEYERLNPGASADSPQRDDKLKHKREKSDAALPGSQNADLRGARRDRRPRGAAT